MAEHITIRPLQPADYPAINQLFTDTVHGINAQDYTPEQLAVWAPKDRAADYWAQRLADHTVYVALIDNKIVGFASLLPDGCIDHLYVHQDFQGKGVATALLIKIENVACERGVHELYTEASITAKPFFQKRGFVVVDEQNKVYKGVSFINYVMRKSLS